MTTTRRERDKRLPEVFDVAIKVFWEKGYSAASVQDIADALGLLQGSVYHYISSKEELLGPVLRRRMCGTYVSPGTSPSSSASGGS